MARILVAIAAYNESHIEQTVASILENASKCNLIHINVCEFRTDNNFALFSEKNITHTKHNTSIPTGVGITRYMALSGCQLFDYVLQCDAHMFLGKFWDENMIWRYEIISKEVNARIVISQHVSPLREDENKKLIIKDVFAEPSMLFINEELRIWSRNWVPQQLPDWRENYAISAAYMFSEASVFVDVPPDPSMFFYGEEHTTYLRLISRGIKSISTDYVDVYHLDKRKNTFDAEGAGDWRISLFTDKRLAVLNAFEKYSLQRTASILDGTITGLWGAPTKALAEEAIAIMEIDINLFKRQFLCL